MSSPGGGEGPNQLREEVEDQIEAAQTITSESDDHEFSQWRNRSRQLLGYLNVDASYREQFDEANIRVAQTGEEHRMSGRVPDFGVLQKQAVDATCQILIAALETHDVTTGSEAAAARQTLGVEPLIQAAKDILKEAASHGKPMSLRPDSKLRDLGFNTAQIDTVGRWLIDGNFIAGTVKQVGYNDHEYLFRIQHVINPDMDQLDAYVRLVTPGIRGHRVQPMATFSDSSSSGRVFVSHAGAEKEFGEVVKEQLLQVALGMRTGDIFFSSHPETSVSLSEGWFAEILSELRRADLAIVLITEAYWRSAMSILETGAALGLSNAVFLRRSTNVKRGVLGNMQLADADDIESVLNFVHDIASKLGRDIPQPAALNRTAAKFVAQVGLLTEASSPSEIQLRANERSRAFSMSRAEAIDAVTEIEDQFRSLFESALELRGTQRAELEFDARPDLGPARTLLTRLKAEAPDLGYLVDEVIRAGSATAKRLFDGESEVVIAMYGKQADDLRQAIAETIRQTG